MARLDLQIEEVQSPQHRRAHHVKLAGIISSPTLEHFQRTLKRLTDTGLDLILDFKGVRYINSTGLGAMLAATEVLGARNSHVALVCVAPDIQRLIHLLGFDNVIRLLEDLPAALDAIDSGMPASALIVPEPTAPSRARAKMDEAPLPRLPEARIILGFAEESHFSRFLQRCFAEDSETVPVASDRQEVARLLGKGRVHLAILDSELPDFHAICALLKTDARNGLVSIISIYSEDRDGEMVRTFRIVEDDYVVEPFEVSEIVALIEREYDRCMDDNARLRQEATLSIPTDNDDILAATETIANLLAGADLEDVTRDAYLYAVREAVDNARRHGNGNQIDRQIGVQYVLDREKIVISIADEGDGFDYDLYISNARDMTPVQQARERAATGGQGGLGINMMLRCCDEMNYDPPGNTVHLIKNLA